MAGGTWSHVRPREQMSVGVGRHNWRLEPVIEKDTLGTNGVNFINEAKKSRLLGLVQWKTLSVIIPSWPLKHHGCLSFSLAFSFFSRTHDFLRPSFSSGFPTVSFPKCTPWVPLYSESVPGSVDVSPRPCLPCLSHVEPRIYKGCWPLSRISHTNTSINKPGPTIGRRGRNHRLDQLLRVWPAAFALLTTVCGKRALSLAPKEWYCMPALETQPQRAQWAPLGAQNSCVTRLNIFAAF